MVPAELIESNPGIRGGEPVMRGTRVPVADVAGMLANWVEWHVLHEYWPSIPLPAGTVCVSTSCDCRAKRVTEGAKKRLTDEDMESYRGLIDMHTGYGAALSWAGEAKLLTELERTRADLNASRPVHYREAAASLRVIADRRAGGSQDLAVHADGIRYAAERLESAARDLTEGESE